MEDQTERFQETVNALSQQRTWAMDQLAVVQAELRIAQKKLEETKKADGKKKEGRDSN